jgi:LPXTG-motif cell wall-anchored protein
VTVPDETTTTSVPPDVPITLDPNEPDDPARHAAPPTTALIGTPVSSSGELPTTGAGSVALVLLALVLVVGGFALVFGPRSRGRGI